MLARASPGVLVERYFTTCSLITCKYGETCTLNSAGRDARRHIRERRRTPTWTLRSFKRRSRKTQNCRYMKLCYDNAAFATLLTSLSLIQPLRTCLIKSCLSSFSITLFAHWFTPPSANQTDFHHWRASIRRAHFRIGCSQKTELNWERKLLGFFLGLTLNVRIFYQWTISKLKWWTPSIQVVCLWMFVGLFPVAQCHCWPGLPWERNLSSQWD